MGMRPALKVLYPALQSTFNPFAGSAAAYSLRIPVGSRYSGPLIRVRRSSDNAETNIGAVLTADVRGNRWLNTTDLLAWVGSASGFVTTLYDQSGNSRHAVQTGPTYQPRIVNAGVVDTLNGNPSLWGVGFNVLEAPAPMPNAGEMVLSLVAKPTTFNNPTVPSNGITSWSMSPDPNRVQAHTPWSDGSVYFDLGGASGGNRINAPLGLAANTPFVATFTASVSQSYQRILINGSQITLDTSGNAAAVSQLNLIGGNKVTDESLRGAFAECVVFASVNVAATQALVRSQGAAFGIAIL